MRLHVKLKEFLSMFFMAILFFPAFNASLFFTGVKPLYSIIKCSTEIFYDWRMLILCFGFMSFSFLNIHVILLTIIKIILNQKNEGSQFRHRHNNTANSYIFTNSYRNSTFNSSFCHRICQY